MKQKATAKKTFPHSSIQLLFLPSWGHQSFPAAFEQDVSSSMGKDKQPYSHPGQFGVANLPVPNLHLVVCGIQNPRKECADSKQKAPLVFG